MNTFISEIKLQRNTCEPCCLICYGQNLNAGISNLFLNGHSRLIMEISIFQFPQRVYKLPNATKYMEQN